jgi:hypothetical protein
VIRGLGSWNQEDEILDSGKRPIDNSLIMKRWILVISLLMPAIGRADLSVHLAAPPRGLTFVELKSEGALSPVLLAGTVTPPSLTMNGQSVSLKKRTEPFTQGPGLWINGRQYPTEDVMGRYFVQVGDSEAAVESLDVLIVSPTEVHEARLFLNRIFLEAPFQQKLVLQNELSGTRTVPFLLTGTITGEFEIKVSGQTVKAKENGIIEIPLKLPVGQKTITIELKRAGSSKRIINLPVTVLKAEYSEDEQVLSFETPSEIDGGLFFKGITNPGAVLKANGNNVAVDANGNFQWEMKSDQPQGKVQFEVQTSSKGLQTYEYDYTCTNCRPQPTSLAKRRGVSFQTTEMATFIFTGDRIPGRVLTSYSSALDLSHVNAGYLHQLGETTYLNFSLGFGRRYDGDQGDTIRLHVKDLYSVSAGFSVQITPRAFGGLVLLMNTSSLAGIGFEPSPAVLNSIGLGAFIEGDFQVSENWSYSPRMSIAASGLAFIKNEAPASWLFVSLQLLGFRRWF